MIPALHVACILFSEPGDGIIIQPPVYYPFMAASAKTGRVRVDNPLVLGEDGRWHMDYEDLEALMVRHDLFTIEGYLFGREGSGFERLNLACPRSVVEWMVGQILEARAEVMGR